MMQIALMDGIRSLPRPGIKAHCPLCNQAMVAKCGEQIQWHWAHRGCRNCDPRWENEGPWHREWKSHFPVEFQEVIGEDDTGEKHIADIKFPTGLVVELQHSGMPLKEMRSREAFYGNMIWIVDAAPFKKNIIIFDALPDPQESFVADLKFVRPLAEWRNSFRRHDDGFNNLMFFRKSELDPDMSLQRIHFGREINDHFPSTYKGHHLFYWTRPRDIWYSTTKPTYFDFGGDVMGLLMRYGPEEDKLTCLQLMNKSTFLEKLLFQVKTE